MRLRNLLVFLVVVVVLFGVVNLSPVPKAKALDFTIENWEVEDGDTDPISGDEGDLVDYDGERWVFGARDYTYWNSFYDAWFQCIDTEEIPIESGHTITSIVFKMNMNVSTTSGFDDCYLKFYNYTSSSWVQVVYDKWQVTNPYNFTYTITTGISHYFDIGTNHFKFQWIYDDDNVGPERDFSIDFLWVTFNFEEPVFSIVYDVANKTFHTIQDELIMWTGNEYNYLDLDGAYGNMLAEDGSSWTAYAYGSNASAVKMEFNFAILSPYTALIGLYYKYQIGSYDTEGASTNVADTANASLYLYTNVGTTLSDTTLQSEGSWRDTSFTLNSSFISDSYIHGTFVLEWTNTSGTIDEARLTIDSFYFDYALVQDTPIIAEGNWEDGREFVEFEFTAFDYGVTTTVYNLTEWTFDRINPNCTVSESWKWVFTNLVPTSYKIRANLTTFITTTEYTDLWLNFHRADGSYIAWGTFIVYVDGEEIPHSWITLEQGATVNITAVDVWNHTVFQDATYSIGTSDNQHLREVLSVYRLHILNRKLEPVYCVIDYSGANATFYVAEGGALAIEVYAGTYTVYWYRASDGHFLESEIVAIADADFIISTNLEFPPQDPPVLGPFFIQLFQTILNNQFYQAIVFGLGLLGVIVTVTIWRRRDYENVWVDTESGVILERRRIKRTKVKVTKPDPHDSGKSIYEQLEEVLEEEDL